MLPTAKDPLPSRLPPEKKGEATDRADSPDQEDVRHQEGAPQARESTRATVGDRFLPTIEALPDNLFGKVQFSRKPFWVHMREKFSWCLATVRAAEVAAIKDRRETLPAGDYGINLPVGDRDWKKD